jgi:hypothetical protein
MLPSIQMVLPIATEGRKIQVNKYADVTLRINSLTILRLVIFQPSLFYSQEVREFRFFSLYCTFLAVFLFFCSR